MLQRPDLRSRKIPRVFKRTKAALNLCTGFALWLPFFAGHASAQTQLAALFGTVMDAIGAIVPGAQVTVVSGNTELKRDAHTDTNGEYRLTALPTGRYTLRVEKGGFQTEVREGIALGPGSVIEINLSLPVGKLAARVTVGAGVPALDTTTASSGGMIGERRLIDLPLDNRDEKARVVFGCHKPECSKSAPNSVGQLW